MRQSSVATCRANNGKLESKRIRGRDETIKHTVLEDVIGTVGLRGWQSMNREDDLNHKAWFLSSANSRDLRCPVEPVLREAFGANFKQQRSPCLPLC